MFIVYGFLGICAVIFGFIALRHKPLISILLGLITFPLVVLSACDWRQALIDSGKDPTLLGYARYPIALTLLVILAAAALICIVIAVILMSRRKNT